MSARRRSAGGGVAAGVAAACALLGVADLYPIGGAQAVAAMAFGTAVVPRCDVIVGPGNAYVTEAKRQVMGEVRIDGLAGPSEVLIVADAGGPRRLAGGRPAAPRPSTAPAPWRRCSTSAAELGDRVADAVAQLAAELGLATDRIAVVACRDRAAALALVNAFAPEHLELHVADAAALVPRVRNAGAIFVGPRAATAFGDYAAGTNHVLPTGGSRALRSGPVGERLRQAGRRRRARRGRGRRGLAGPVATIAEEEGLRSHARSVRLRGRAVTAPPAAPGGDRRRGRRGRRRASSSPSTATAAPTVSTGDAFLDHLLELAARHARFDLTITTGRRRGRRRSRRRRTSPTPSAGRCARPWATSAASAGPARPPCPVDEALALVALDLSGRPYLAYDVDLAGVRIDEFDADLAGRFLRALVEAAGITLHVRLLSGSDPHHIVDAVFEGLGEALRTACETLA